LINKRNKEIQLELPAEANNAEMFSVNGSTYENQALQTQVTSNIITLKPFAVSVIKFKN